MGLGGRRLTICRRWPLTVEPLPLCRDQHHPGVGPRQSRAIRVQRGWRFQGYPTCRADPVASELHRRAYVPGLPTRPHTPLSSSYSWCVRDRGLPSLSACAGPERCWRHFAEASPDIEQRCDCAGQQLLRRPLDVGCRPHRIATSPHRERLPKGCRGLKQRNKDRESIRAIPTPSSPLNLTTCHNTTFGDLVVPRGPDFSGPRSTRCETSTSIAKPVS